MTSKSPTRKPSERRIGARIAVLLQYEQEAATRFAAADLVPIYVDRKDEAAPSFWFGKMSPEEQYRLATAIPFDWYAKRMVVVGESPPFRGC